MSISHVTCNVEQFRAGGWPGYDERNKALFIDEMRLTGWFLSHADIASAELLAAGAMSGPMPLETFQRESEGLFGVYGDRFGQRARRARFAVAWPMPDRTIDLSGARLRITMTDGHVFERALGTPVMDFPADLIDSSARDVLAGFESIGDNCEFGLVQRRAGIERMSLLKFAGNYDPVALASVIAGRFAGFAEGDDAEFVSLHGEWVCRIRSAQLEIHTGRFLRDMTQAQIEREERGKLQFLAQKLCEDLETGGRTLVFRAYPEQRGGGDGTRGMAEIHAAIQTYGVSNLLWLTEATDEKPHGTVERVDHRLFRGYLRRLTPYHDAHAGDDAAWIEVLSAAKRVIDEAANHDG